MDNINEKMLNGVTKAIYDEFGEDYQVYAENLNAELEKPCFTVRVLDTTLQRLLNITYQFDDIYMVQFFPADDSPTPQKDCRNARFGLMCCLEDVLGIQGTKMSSKIVDNVLSFSVNYKYFGSRSDGSVPVENLSITTGRK